MARTLLSHSLLSRVVAGLCFASASSCVELVGIEELPGKDPLYSTCARELYPSTTCAECVDTRCCEEAADCAGDPLCADDLACRSRCASGDDACRIACGPERPLENPFFAKPFEECRRTKCLLECVGCGVYGDGFRDATATCLEKESCEHARDCAARPGCDEAAYGVMTCADPACSYEANAPRAVVGLRTGDQAVIDAAVADYDALANIVNDVASCRMKAPPDFRCVGKYSIPNVTPLGESQVYVLRLAEFLSAGRRPVDGIKVRLCQALAFPCVELSRAQSDGSGVAVVDVPVRPTSAFSGYLEFNDPEGIMIPHFQVLDRFFTSKIDFLEMVPGFLANVLVQRFTDDVSSADRAGAVFSIGDCRTATAKGVTLRFVGTYAGEPVHYDPDDPEDELQVTDDQGLAFALIAAEGGRLKSDHLEYEATSAEGQIVGKGTLPIRLGTISRVFVEPLSDDTR